MISRSWLDDTMYISHVTLKGKGTKYSISFSVDLVVMCIMKELLTLSQDL